jgi:hypothetical protein
VHCCLLVWWAHHVHDSSPASTLALPARRLLDTQGVSHDFVYAAGSACARRERCSCDVARDVRPNGGPSTVALPASGLSAHQLLGHSVVRGQPVVKQPCRCVLASSLRATSSSQCLTPPPVCRRLRTQVPGQGVCGVCTRGCVTDARGACPPSGCTSVVRVCPPDAHVVCFALRACFCATAASRCPVQVRQAQA